MDFWSLAHELTAALTILILKAATCGTTPASLLATSFCAALHCVSCKANSNIQLRFDPLDTHFY